MISFAECFHWLDKDKVCEEVSELLKKSNGICVIVSYALFNFHPKNEIGQKINFLFDKFKQIIVPYFAFDQNELNCGYDSYNFKKYFKNVKKIVINKAIPMGITGILGYLQTWSALQRYFQVNKVDLLEKLIDDIKGEVGMLDIEQLQVPDRFGQFSLDFQTLILDNDQ